MKSQSGPTRQRGGMAVEAALLLPMVVLLIFGMIEFSLLLYNRQVITNASREGARAGIVLGTPRVSDGEISTVVNQYATNRLVTFGSAAGPSTSVTRTGTEFGADLTVRVTYDYDFLVLSSFGFGPIELAAETVMRLE